MGSRTRGRAGLLAGTLTTLLATAVAAQQPPVVAVFDLQPQRVKLDRGALTGLTDYLATRLAETGAYRVVPRDQLRQRLVGQKKESYKECFNQGCQIEIGRELAASKTLSTKVTRLGKRCVLTASLYDLAQAATDKAATAKTGCEEEDLMGAVDRLVADLTAGKAIAPGPRKGAEVDLRWPPACPPSNPLTCQKLALKRRIAGDKAGAYLAGAFGEHAAVEQGDWVRVDEAWFHSSADLKTCKRKPKLIAVLEPECKAEDWSACDVLGRVEKSMGRSERALALFRKACQAGSKPACEDLADTLADEKGIEHKPEAAYTLRTKTCANGHQWACRDLARTLVSGKGTKKNPTLALKISRQGCKAGDTKSCRFAAMLLFTGKGVPQDRPAAVRLIRQACELGNLAACDDLADCLQRGRGVKKDPVSAVFFFERGCDGGRPNSCARLGMATAQGLGASPDPARAAKLLSMACSLDHAGACVYLAALYYRGDGVPKDGKQAVAHYRKACDLGNAEGCSGLGDAYSQGLGVARDMLAGLRWFERACKMGNKDACAKFKILDGHLGKRKPRIDPNQPDF